MLFRSGKSGSGKTTFLSLISGLDKCKEGEILFEGISLNRLDRDNYRARDIGIIFQGYNLLINNTALENIVLAMNISKAAVKDKKKHALKLLEQVGISPEQANRKVLKLSGGEQQRVSIARALAHDAKVLIADEPTGNLDSSTELEILQIFQKLAHENNKCVIIVTHSQSVSSRADEVWGLNKGELLFIRATKED